MGRTRSLCKPIPENHRRALTEALRGRGQLIAALERLRGTSIKANIKMGGVENTSGFGLIDSWNVMRHTESGRMSEMRVNLSDWIYNAPGLFPAAEAPGF
jgi:hypothetical protein